MSFSRFETALAALDGLIAAELQRLNARYALSLDEFRGLYVSDVMVESLLTRSGIFLPMSPTPRLTAPLIAPLRDIGSTLSLCPLSRAVLVLALAPELDAKYPAIFAYLNDDVTRRWPTLDLARRLFVAPGDKKSARRLQMIFSPALPLTDGGLVGAGLLCPAELESAPRPHILQAWRAASPLVHHALALPNLPMPELSWLSMSKPDGQDEAHGIRVEDVPPVVLITGPSGSGRSVEACRWAHSLGKRALLYRGQGGSLPDTETLRGAALTARLNSALLVLDLTAAARPAPLPGLDPALPVAVLTGQPDGWAAALAPRLTLHRPVELPDSAARAELWRAALTAGGQRVCDKAVNSVAGRFQLPPRSIERAARRLCWERQPVPDEAALIAAARAESGANLGNLARLVTTAARWDDLVLPAGALSQLKDLAGAIAARDQVFEAWGFGAVGRGTGQGLAALFSGGSGTGKTMSAAIIAAELGLDLWRIDLAGMVSKYIGETEKNLEQLFSAAGAGNAILFFDEADALFGKRSEVKDSHDRYANIEIAYLLQRLEQHEGVVILATNLSRNLDSAFLRRLPFVIDFPMPDAEARARLWRKAIPHRAPLCADVDFAELAQHFELSGGDIRTAALDAAFQAAARKCPIDHDILDTAVRRQLIKRGQVPGRFRRARANGHLPGTAAPAGDA